jgi:hypothetical protein
LYEGLQEPIAVIALFESGKLSPLRFRWGGRVYRVREITGRWVVPKGENRHTHYALVCGDEGTFEISYDQQKTSWKLRTILLGGESISG